MKCPGAWPGHSARFRPVSARHEGTPALRRQPPPIIHFSGQSFEQALHSSQHTVASRLPLHDPGQSGKPPGRVAFALPCRVCVEAGLDSILAHRPGCMPVQSLDCTNVACNDPPVPASVWFCPFRLTGNEMPVFFVVGVVRRAASPPILSG